ncbi:MAG: S8/S53 family peptidase [Polyangiales bacterium]
MKEEVLQYALDRFPHELVEVVIDLGEVPFPELTQLRSMDEETRARVLADRVESIEAGQDEFLRYLERIGAKVGSTPGIVNHRQAWIPPGAIHDVLDHPDVKAVYPAWQPMIALYDGEETRQETFLSEYWNHGIKGETGGRVNLASYGGDDIKIGIVETAWIDRLVCCSRILSGHPGWQDWTSGPSRVRIESVCGDPPGNGYCTLWQDPPNYPDRAFHGTWVASIAAGDITQGQDPNVTNSLQRKRRSGIAPEASLFYLSVITTGDLATAIAWAFLWGADVINLSMAIQDCGCGAAADCGGVNDVIRWVTEGGALVVAAAGNLSPDGTPQCTATPTCNVCYPATRPEVISVGNVDTPGSIDYDVAQIADDSSTGWVRAGVGGQYGGYFPDGVDIPAVSLAAPGTRSLYFGDFDPDAGIYTYGTEEHSGTSFAAPVVSGGAGLVREELGSSVADARMLKAQVLAMGDGTGAEEPTAGVKVGTSEVYGPAGKVKFHPWSEVVQPANRARRTFVINENDLVIFNRVGGSGPLSSSVTEWKMAAFIDAPDLTQVPYILISYWDVCSGSHELIAYDFSPGLERYISVESPVVDSACIEIRMLGYSVPPGGVEVFVVDYYHSGDPSEH